MMKNIFCLVKVAEHEHIHLFVHSYYTYEFNNFNILYLNIEETYKKINIYITFRKQAIRKLILFLESKNFLYHSLCRYAEGGPPDIGYESSIGARDSSRTRCRMRSQFIRIDYTTVFISTCKF